MTFISRPSSLFQHKRGNRANGLLLLLTAVLITSFLSLISHAQAATFNVTLNTDGVDALPGNGFCITAFPPLGCTLRAAVMEANALAGDDVIVIPEGMQINLDRQGADPIGVPPAENGDLNITDNLQILGGGLDQPSATPIKNRLSIIEASSLSHRIFRIQEIATVLLRGLILRHGASALNGGAVEVAAGANNILTLDQCVVQNNTAGDNGAGINVAENARLTLYDTDVVGNYFLGGPGYGAAINNLGTTNIYRSSFRNNYDDDGPQIFSDSGSTLIIENSTIGATGAGYPTSRSGIWSIDAESLVIENSTIVGHVFNGVYYSPAVGAVPADFSISRTAFNDNGEDCEQIASGQVTNNNWFEDITDCNTGTGEPNTIGTLDANDLGPIQSASHLVTWFYNLPETSDLIDAVTGQGCLLSTDQRGAIRPFDGDNDGIAACDIGAYELNSIIFMDGFEL